MRRWYRGLPPSDITEKGNNTPPPVVQTLFGAQNMLLSFTGGCLYILQGVNASQTNALIGINEVLTLESIALTVLRFAVIPARRFSDGCERVYLL